MPADFYDGKIALSNGQAENAYFYSSNVPATQANLPVYTSNGVKYVAVNRSDIASNTIQAFNSDSPFWIRYNNAWSGAFLTAWNNPGETWRKCIELANGNYVMARRYSEWSSTLDIALYRADGTPLYSSGQGRAFGEGVRFACITAFDDGIDVFPSLMFYAPDFNQLTIETTGSNIANFNWLDENIIPSYTWTPFEQLAGNEGQFRLNLSQIKAEYIGDGATTEATQDNDRFIIEPLTSLRKISGNFALDEERTIAWCGHHYATLTKHFSADTYSIRLKLYFNPDLPAVYDSGYMYFFDDLDDYYLSFIYDASNQVARVNLIHYYEANGSYWWSYNEGLFPSSEELIDVYVWLSTNSEISDNPYDTGTTDDGGDPGTPRPQDHIYTPALPTKSGLGLGLIGLYHPTPSQLADIADLLWSDTLIDNVLKYFSNFADNILCLYVLPFLPSNLPQTHFTIGHYATEIDNVDYVTTRYYNIDMGSVTLEPLWDSYLDYEPYSRCQIYLPYIGMKDLDIDELMCPTDINGMMPKASGCTLSLLYRLDILTGAILAQVKISNEYLTGEVRYQFSGKVGYNIPLTGETYNGIISSLLSVATAGASALMTGGLTAPLVDGAAIAGTIQAQKGSVTHAGNLSGDVSMMSQKTPYIEISCPNKPYLDLQENFTGFPSYKSDKLDNFSGYTEVLEVHAEGFVCTEPERTEIIRLLKEGVLL